MLLKYLKLKSIHPLYIFAISWSLLLLMRYVTIVPQPETTIGYLWKYEFAIAFFLSIFCVFILTTQISKKFTIFDKNEFYFVILPLVFFTIWSFLSIIWSRSGRHALHHSLLWSCYLIFYLFVRIIVSYKRLLNASMLSLSVILSIFSLSCAIEYLGFLFGLQSSFIGFRYSKFAEIAVTVLPVILFFTWQKSQNKRNFTELFSIILWILVICSFARTQLIVGFLCLVISIAAVYFFRFDKQIRNRIFRVSAVCLFITIAITYSSSLTSSGASSLSRLTNSSDVSAQDSAKFRPLMVGISLQMLKENLFLGVGADNFLIDYKNARTEFSNTRFDERLIGISEDIIPERSHNEFVQILAELGIIGGLIFGWFFFGIAKMTFRLLKTSSPLAIGSLLGIYAFLICSLASSFSFRLPSNALCFFFILAIAVSKLFNGKEKIDLRKLLPQARPLLAFSSLIFCFGMLAFSAVRGTNLFFVDSSQKVTEKPDIQSNLEKALYFDQSDGVTNYQFGSFLYTEKRYAEAAKYFRVAINNGISTSTNYFDLAANQMLANQTENAHETFLEAIKLYPRSVFLRTTFSQFLKENANLLESKKQLDIALELNESDAKSWAIINSGDLSVLAIANAKSTQAMDLTPLNGVYALIEYQKRKSPEAFSR
jgi:Tfp pilus assembly protein PilF